MPYLTINTGLVSLLMFQALVRISSRAGLSIGSVPVLALSDGSWVGCLGHWGWSKLMLTLDIVFRMRDKNVRLRRRNLGHPLGPGGRGRPCRTVKSIQARWATKRGEQECWRRTRTFLEACSIVKT
ncbi:hypothetical protein GYMLUDRAFT_966324 [Collybiopsis luxurians FD-317 M1]|uniref:Secreted protein n=1 Tax=Collybiopsis luxurians FD-317 M1 TaxID=944289 RepID=A0A0D0CC67_9AGAR|nr:hypothetical protein GYMLUDRAFT_966324 [Collybiopsis luxurians FD-317 M1]